MSSASESLTPITDAHLSQDFDGEPLDANSGIEYFKKCFARLAQTAGRSKEREIYIQSVAFWLFWVIVTVHTETWSALQLRQIPHHYGQSWQLLKVRFVASH